MWFLEGVAEFGPKNQLFLKKEEDATFARFVFCWLKVIFKRLQEGEYLS